MGGNEINQKINQNAENYINRLVLEFGAELEPIVKKEFSSAVSDLEKTARMKTYIPILAYNTVRNFLHEKYPSLKHKNIGEMASANSNPD